MSSEPQGGSTREVARRGRQASSPIAPQRTDSGSLGHGYSSAYKGHVTRGAAERIAAYQEQKRVVAQREVQRRAAESSTVQRQTLDKEIATQESRLQNLKRQRAGLRETP